MRSIRRIFITGLTALIPFALTIYIIVKIFRFGDKFVGPLINNFLKREFSFTIPGIGFIFTILIIFVVGLLIDLSRQRLLKIVENIFLKIPIIGKIYSSLKDIFSFFFKEDKAKNFKHAVLVEWPRKGVYSLGFLIKECSSEINTKTSKKMYFVFIPSTPSPLTGFTTIVSEDEIIFLDASIEEVAKTVISGGMIGL